MIALTTSISYPWRTGNSLQTPLDQLLCCFVANSFVLRKGASDLHQTFYSGTKHWCSFDFSGLMSVNKPTCYFLGLLTNGFVIVLFIMSIHAHHGFSKAKDKFSAAVVV